MRTDLEFEAWRDTLRGYCGNFDVTPGAGLPDRHGSFGKHSLGGMEMSRITTNYQSIQRDRACIRGDDMDCLYLVRQLAGRMRIVTARGTAELTAGDCILLDSTEPLEGHYARTGVDFATLHVPREALLREPDDLTEVECGVARGAEDPRGRALSAALEFVGARGLDEAEGRGFVIDLARLVFRRDPRAHSLHRFARSADRVTALIEAIHRKAADPAFSLAGLAHLAGMSERQVQRDLQGQGTSFSAETMRVRMDRVCRQLRRASARGARPQVAQIAYGAGFNDLSHFNRAFRRMHGCTPIEYAFAATES